MDIFHLKLERTDFSRCSNFRWQARRIFVGGLLCFYYLYATVFFFIVAAPEQDLLEMCEDTAELGAGCDIPPLLMMATFGFIGGVFSLTRTFIRTAQKYREEGITRLDYPVSWYISRPMQSALMSVFVYYTFLAGQLMFFNSDGQSNQDEINLYTMALLAIVAGAFSDEAFIKLHSVATNFFKVEKKKADDQSER